MSDLKLWFASLPPVQRFTLMAMRRVCERTMKKSDVDIFCTQAVKFGADPEIIKEFKAATIEKGFVK